MGDVVKMKSSVMLCLEKTPAGSPRPPSGGKPPLIPPPKSNLRRIPENLAFHQRGHVSCLGPEQSSRRVPVAVPLACAVSRRVSFSLSLCSFATCWTAVIASLYFN